MRLHNERCGSNVGKQYALGKGELEDIAHVKPVMQHRAEVVDYVGPSLPVASFREKGFDKVEATR